MVEESNARGGGPQAQAGTRCRAGRSIATVVGSHCGGERAGCEPSGGSAINRTATVLVGFDATAAAIDSAGYQPEQRVARESSGVRTGRGWQSRCCRTVSVLDRRSQGFGRTVDGVVVLRSRLSILLASCLLVWVAGGATCHRRTSLADLNPPPVIFTETPSAAELIAAINRTDAVQKMQSTSTTVELLDSPLPIKRLNATLALERPRRLRMRVSVPIALGAGMDVGSNDEVFWMRYPEGMQQTLLFARHEEFQHHMLGSPLPVDPTWITEALGLLHIDPSAVIGEPIVRADKKLELRTQVPTASGVYTRVLHVDAQGGFVRDQYLYAPDGRLVASANGAEHRFYEEARIVLPHSVRVQLQPVAAPPLGLQIEIGSYVLNQLLGSDPNLFAMPADGNGQVIDLSRIGGNLPPASLNPNVTLGQPSGVTQTSTYVPTASYSPTLRGTQLR